MYNAALLKLLLDVKNEDSFAKYYYELVVDKIESLEDKAFDIVKERTRNNKKLDSEEKIDEYFTEEMWVDLGNMRDHVIRKELCPLLHKYLVEHNGIVTRWPIPDCKQYSVVKDKNNLKLKYDWNYFGDFYKKRGDTIERHSDQLVFYNEYIYEQPRPSETECVDQVLLEFEKKNKKELTNAKVNCSLAYKELEESKKNKEKKRKASKGLIAIMILLLLFANAMLFLFKGTDIMLNMSLSYKDLISNITMTGTIKKIVYGISMIPMFIFNILLLAQGFLTAVLQLFKELHIGLFYAGIGIISLVLWYFIGFINKKYACKNFKLKNSCKQVQAKIKQCEMVKDNEQQKYDRLLKEFKDSNTYLNARQKDKQRIADYELDKKLNEEFALEWQKAWFDAITAERLNYKDSTNMI